MCAFCISLLFILVFASLKMSTDGLPLNRQERGVHQDIIAGEDFLSILMESPALRQAYKELSTTEMPSVTRLSRSTPTLDRYEYSQIGTRSFMESTDLVSPSDLPNFNTTDKELPILQEHQHNVDAYVIDVTTSREDNIVFNTHTLSEVTKSEYNTDEIQPVTFSHYPTIFNGKVEVPENDNHEVTQSQSIIYHQTPIQSNNGRSVSYSTVIQSLPKRSPLNWNDENQPQPRGERKERHYNIHNASNENKLNLEGVKYKNKQTFSWDKSEHPYTSTEKNWELPEKEHVSRESPITPTPGDMHRFPIIYGKPEENYEVDEAVSVMSKGRVHGVQTLNKNDNQKVGYVVEGRNYKKYRVEERTSDGFIVGEYGVVSHDDGSLRGVRYTADGTINPRIVYDALMKFLSL